MEASNYNANRIFAKELEDELMKFTTTPEDHELHENVVDHRHVDTDVNITECTRSVPLVKAVVEVDRHDTTENSSSFDNSDCGLENVDGLGDEAISNFHGDASSALDFDGFGELFRMRKKRPTAHWRSFIQPLTWRCKWTELQINKLQWQAEQYDKALEACNRSKHEKNYTTEGECARSLPFTHVNANNKVLQRNKRKRVEATTDVASYMSHHNLFSYYENRKSFAEGAFNDKESKNAAIQKMNMDDEIDDDPYFGGLGDGANSFEHMLRKIDYLQSQVGKLKDRADAVISQHGGKYSWIDDISLPKLVGDVNGSSSHACFGDAYVNVEDGDLIDNRTMNEEMNPFEEAKNHQIQRPLVIRDEPVNPSPSTASEPELPTDDQQASKTPSVARTTPPNNKRKRGRRRGSGRWGRRS